MRGGHPLLQLPLTPRCSAPPAPGRGRWPEASTLSRPLPQACTVSKAGDIPTLFLQDRDWPRQSPHPPSVPAATPRPGAAPEGRLQLGHGDKGEGRPGELRRVYSPEGRSDRGGSARIPTPALPWAQVSFLPPRSRSRTQPCTRGRPGSCVRLSVRLSVLHSQRQLALTSLNPASRNQFS